jgi:hypothetical protein
VAETGLPQLDVARVQRWCKQRVPESVRDQVRIECEVAARHLTIVESRPPWRADLGPDWIRTPHARLAYTKSRNIWTLYYRDRNLRFHKYAQKLPTASIDELLDEIDRDPTALFWG